MSTYYSIACETHKIEGPTIGGRSFPQRWWGQGDDTGPFLEAHANCTLVVFSEHDPRSDEYAPWSYPSDAPASAENES